MQLVYIELTVAVVMTVVVVVVMMAGVMVVMVVVVLCLARQPGNDFTGLFFF